MSIWGKIIGGTTGFALGGPLGALLGVIAGHGVDKAKISKNENYKPKISSEESEQIFATGVIALAAKLSKIDGTVTKNEIDTFKKIFEFPNKDMRIISKLFNAAKNDASNYQSYAYQLKECFTEQKILHEILNALFAIAYADGILHNSEEKMLKDISEIFKIKEQEYIRIKGIYNSKISSNYENIKGFYELLGVSENDSLENIKKKYRKIIKEYHPDTIQGKGLPDEFINFANKKLIDFNEAYNGIKKYKEKKNL